MQFKISLILICWEKKISLIISSALFLFLFFTRNGESWKNIPTTPIVIFNILNSLIKKKTTSFIQQHRLVVQPNTTSWTMQTTPQYSNEEPPFPNQAQNYLPGNASSKCLKSSPHHAKRSTWQWPKQHANKEPQNMNFPTIISPS